ncbi:MAG TPA: hypothetical protein ENF82_04430 [Candidatus Methanomethylia archaeon]|nr:hypothetical protein [Candidatus Verstraetearchaeota archaeon]HDI47034.1 hypothetical protein [Candidatus Methanomethylicia archaeon]
MQRRGIANVFGALLFVIALVVIISTVAILASEYSNYVRAVDYVNKLEAAKLQERLLLQAKVDASGTLLVNISNLGGVTVQVVCLAVHDKSSSTLTLTSEDLVVNPGQTIYNFNTGLAVTPTTNCTLLFITSRGSSFPIIVEGGRILT